MCPNSSPPKEGSNTKYKFGNLTIRQFGNLTMNTLQSPEGEKEKYSLPAM